MSTTAQSPAAVAMKWWHRMQPYDSDGTPNPLADRGALARLRRSDLRAAMIEPAVFDLHRQLGHRDPRRLVEAALCACVLATVREHRDGLAFARQLGASRGGHPLMSTLRFRTLLAAETPEERLNALRRAVLLADAKVNVFDLAAACFDWSDTRRTRWAFDYYDATTQTNATGVSS